MGSSYGEKREHGHGHNHGHGHGGTGSIPSENINKGVQALLKDLKSLQQDGGRGGDLKFSLKDGHCAKAHSLIIKARCKSFKEEISTSFPLVSQEVFNIFLTYVYTGKLKVDSTQPLILYPVYLLALELGVPDLSNTCEELMISNMDHNSALTILQEAMTSLSSPRRPEAIKNENGCTKSNSNSSSTNGTNSGPDFTSNGNGIAVSGVSVKSAIKRLTLSPAQNSTCATPPLPTPPATSYTQLSDEIRAKLQRIVDTAITFLSENNPTGLKRNSNFLALPVETIKVILDSEHLCLEEEEVWRCVLRWAQSKAGVETHVSHWKEEERVSVSEFLSPVISHIKLLLIDSRVFAEEVEPTGCVPMTLSLERYRTAALSNFDATALAGSGEIDPRLTPRNAQKLFHSSLIINNERMGLGKKLQEWHAALWSSPSTGGNINTNWKCVYRASQHGFGAEDFHARVDGLRGGPSLILVLLKNNKWICGGYTDVPWSSSKSPKYVSSSKSFLFAMNPTTNGTPVQFQVKKKNFAVCHDANSGPIFGAGADLYISSMCGSNSDSYTNLPHSYEQNGSSNSGDAGGNNCSPRRGQGHGQGQETSPGSRSRSTTPSSNSTASPTGLDLPIIPSIKRGKHGNNHKLLEESSIPTGGSFSGPLLLAPSYHFTVADYEVFIPNN